MGMCKSFRWFLARKLWGCYVLFKEIFWNWSLTFDSGNAQVWDSKQFPVFFSANTGQKPVPYSGIGSRNSAKILGLAHNRSS